MRFNRAYTAAPQCAPSRISIFAGRSPVGLSTTRFAQPARADVRLVTDLLRENGYWVGLDGRHQHLDGKNKDAQHITDTLVELGMRDTVFESRFDHFVRGANTKGAALAKVPDMFSAVLDQVPRGKPFFLYFGFNQPHRKWAEAHDGIDPAELELPSDWPDLPEVRLDYARYLAEVSDLDTGIGMLMQILADRGLNKNTLVVFMGDNGEALLRGKGTLYSRGLHVPLIVRWPGKVQAGSESDALISGVDLAATMLEAAGVDPTGGVSGISFLPALVANHSNRGTMFLEREVGTSDRSRVPTVSTFPARSSHERYNFIYNAIPDRTYTPVDMAKGNVAWEAVREAHREWQSFRFARTALFSESAPRF